jgi:hypothetical protein
MLVIKGRSITELEGEDGKPSGKNRSFKEEEYLLEERKTYTRAILLFFLHHLSPVICSTFGGPMCSYRTT